MYWLLWICVFAYRENHEWYLIQSPRLPPAVPQSLTPARCPWTMLPSPILHYRLPQVHSVHRPTHNPHCFLGVLHQLFHSVSFKVIYLSPFSLCVPKQVRQDGTPFRPAAYPTAARPLWARPSLVGASAVRPSLCGLCSQPGHSLLLPEIWTRRRSHFRCALV